MSKEASKQHRDPKIAAGIEDHQGPEGVERTKPNWELASRFREWRWWYIQDHFLDYLTEHGKKSDGVEFRSVSFWDEDELCEFTIGKNEPDHQDRN